jgi:hypothetical protein
MPLELAGLVMLPLLFPEGRLPSRRWRPVAAVMIAGIVAAAVLGALSATLPVGERLIDNPVGVAGMPMAEESAYLVPLWPLGFALAVAAMAVRFRRSEGVERLQIKWFLAAASLLLLLPVLEIARLPLVSDAIFLLTLVALPAAVGVAVLRYRLYDIDRLISRTLAYAVLSALLAALYLGSVTVLTAVTSPVTGESPLAVAAATLLAAAAFQPLRRRVQSGVDRRFNRARYDAALAVDGYRARLRDELDLTSIGDELLTTARATLQPAAGLLWLRPEGRP